MKIKSEMWRRAALCLLVAAFAVGCGDDADSLDNNAENSQTANNAENSQTANNAENSQTANNAENSQAETGLEVTGTWETQFDTTEVITDTEWNGTAIVDYSNDDNVAILQSPEDDEFTPNQFSRLVWTEPEAGSFYYCMVDFGLETEEEAQNSMMMADDSDPDNSGCGMFSWTKMTLVE